MAIFRDIKFNTGTCNDRLGAVGTVTGSTFSQKEKGLAIETGQGKYIQYDKQLLPNGAFSVVVWAKIKDTATTVSTNGIMGNASTGAGQLIILYSGGINGATLRLGSNNFKYFNSTLDKNWKCYIFTCNGNSQTDVTDAKMFINAVERASAGYVTTGTQDILRSSYTYTGGEYGGGSGGVQMSRMKVYDHVLSLQEINAEQVEFNNAQPINKPKKGFVLNKPTDLSEYKGSGAGQGLVAAYNMQKVGNTLVDISGNGYVGVIDSGIVQTKNGLLFDLTKRINLNNLPLSGKTITILFKLNKNIQTSVNRMLILGSNQFGWGSTTGTYCHISSSSGTDTNALTATLSSIANQTIAYTIDLTNNNVSLYANAIFIASAALPNSKAGNFNSTSMVIGDNSNSIQGEIQDLRIYNRVLTLQEIKDYNNSFIQPTLLEDFSDAGADNQASVPREWAKTSGSFKVVENVIKQGELVTNGDFSSAAGWTLLNATILGGTLNCNGVGTNDMARRTFSVISTPIGKRFLIKYDITSYVSGGVRVILGGYQSGAIRNSVGSYSEELSVYGTSSINDIFISATGSGFVGTVDNVSVTEIQPLQTITNGTKYLEAITAGVVATPSNTAYGSWEMDFYKGGVVDSFGTSIISSTSKAVNNAEMNGYDFGVNSSLQYRLNKRAAGVDSNLQLANSLITANTWYRIKITRTTTGLFTVLIKGGSFAPTAGYDGWTLVSLTSGTNPVTDNTYTTSNYFVMSLGAGDRVTNIKITNGLSSVSIPPTWLYGDNVLSQFWGDNLGLELWGDNL